MNIKWCKVKRIVTKSNNIDLQEQTKVERRTLIIAEKRFLACKNLASYADGGDLWEFWLVVQSFPSSSHSVGRNAWRDQRLSTYEAGKTYDKQNFPRWLFVAWTPFCMCRLFYHLSHPAMWDEWEQLKMCFSPALKNNDAISGSLLRILYGSQQRKDFLRIWARLTAGPSSELYMVYSGRLLWRLRIQNKWQHVFGFG